MAGIEVYLFFYSVLKVNLYGNFLGTHPLSVWICSLHALREIDVPQKI